MSLLLKAVVLEHRQISTGFYYMKIDVPPLAEIAKAGQFIHIKCGSTTDPLLRRPISIHSVDRLRGIISLLYKVSGRGTALLAQLQPNDQVDLMGPLGNGFNLPLPGSSVAVVAGGIGVAPLFFLIQELIEKGMTPEVFMGARCAEDLLVKDKISALGVPVNLATDDGSCGHKGTVTELLAPRLNNNGLDKIDLLYTCGPLPMMKAVAILTALHNVNCQVSLEERMGCGVGACLACVCKIKVKNSDATYKRVCADGPVFNAGEVAWDD